MISKILRSLPEFKGKGRISKNLLSHFIKSSRDIHIKGKYGVEYLLPNAVENIGFQLLINGVYENYTIKFLSAELKEGKSLLDIGANIGAISLPVSKLCSTNQIVCVEASPWVYQYLNTNVKNNSSALFTLINRAVTTEDNNVVKFYSPLDQFGKGSLSPVFTNDSMDVLSTSLDSILDEYHNVGVIKIDIEGYEYSAFLGGRNALERPNAPNILFEFVDWAETRPGSAQELLMEYGYHIYLFNNGKVGKRIQSPVRTGACMLWAKKPEVV